MKHCILLIVSVLGPAFLVSSYPNGAPPEACNSLRPGHHKDKNDPNSPLVEPQTGKPYFSIHVDKRNVTPGEIVEVTIQADDLYYEGFILQARDVNEQTSDSGVIKKYGNFTVLDSKAKLLCDTQAVTHAEHERFNFTKVKWTAPQEKVENIRFIATVVKSYDTIFMNVHSETLNFSDTVSLVPSCIVTAVMICFALCSANI